MSHLKQKHKDYLIKNEIKDLTDLVNYVEILRNTSDLKGEDRQMLFDFAFLIINEQFSLKSFFAENKNPSKEFYNAFKQNTSSPTLLEKVINDVCDKIDKGEWKGFNNNGFIFDNPIQSFEEINNSPTFMDEVINDLQDKEIFDKKVEKYRVGEYDNKIAMVNILDMIIEADSTKNKTETRTEEPNFVSYLPGTQLRRGKIIKYEPNQENGKKETEGVKLNKNKPQMSLLFKQFPKALEAIVMCSQYGHEKYKETDQDFLNFKRVEGGSKTYADAGLRHRMQQGIDLESMLPHSYHVAWNALAELELLFQENS